MCLPPYYCLNINIFRETVHIYGFEIEKFAAAEDHVPMFLCTPSEHSLGTVLSVLKTAGIQFVGSKNFCPTNQINGEKGDWHST
jgi:REP element-mobilizing transposase RayT